MRALIIFTAFTILHGLGPAVAQTEPPTSAARATQPDTQKPQAAGDLAHVVDPATQKTMDQALLEPRRIAAAVVAADNPSPKMIVENGAHLGEFLAVFLNRFPNARGQWTEGKTPDHTLSDGKPLLGRFGDRVDYKFGCLRRDLAQGCIPKGTDVILMEWLSIHQDLDAMYKNYRAAFDQLPQGGWVVDLDHVGFGGSSWEPRLHQAAREIRPAKEGPEIHHQDYRVPTVDEQLGAMRAAGFDAHVVWQSFATVLFMGRKN